MKRMMLCMTGLLLLWVNSPRADEMTETAATAPTGVAIAAIGDISAEHMERIRAFVEYNTSIRARLLESQPEAGGTFSEMLDALHTLRTPELACVVFLYAGEQDFEEHTVYRYESGVGMVNAKLMMTDDEERYLRRLEKLTMRSVGLLLDVPLVPNPQSAMWTYRTMEELDAMGRNYDPPSLMRIQENALQREIPLIKDNPYLLVDPQE